MSKPIGARAVVIGAGMGGLGAAKALSDYFEQVTIIDRDVLPEKPEPRRGTPQSRHAHALLTGGCKALAELFPSFEEDIERAGAIRTRTGLDIMWERPGYDPFPQRDLVHDNFCASRPLIEFTVRRALERVPNVKLLSRCRATELLASADRNRVTAVRCENEESKTETLPADVIVDASGRGALTLSLLESIGAATPETSEIGVDEAYSTAIFEIPPDAPSEWKGLVHLPDPRHTGRGGLIVPMENNRWIVALGGRHGDAPPEDIEGFVAFAGTLRTATIYNAIRNAKQVHEIVRFRFPSSIRRHFERLEFWPRGLIPLGDSICRFNPAFGQGMTVAAQEARMLGRLLGSRSEFTDPLDGLALAYFAEVQELLEAPWSTAESDFAYPKTRGNRPPDLDQRFRFGAALTRLAAEDPVIHALVTEVTSLVRPQSALRDPELRSRVNELMIAGC
jgi:2-polyprenyl-6-methoxyphenol hydroxylase-like FAD-dependent oxidoreductase